MNFARTNVRPNPRTLARTLARTARRSQRGLSMIETVAALTILAIGAAIIFSWTAQTTTVLARAELAEKRHLARLAALDYLRTINPVQRPTGEQLLRGGDTPIKLRWTSTAVEVAARPALSEAGQADAYVLSMYDVKGVLSQDPAVEGVVLEVSLVGYKMTRTGSGGFFGDLIK